MTSLLLRLYSSLDKFDFLTLTLVNLSVKVKSEYYWEPILPSFVTFHQQPMDPAKPEMVNALGKEI